MNRKERFQKTHAEIMELMDQGCTCLVLEKIGKRWVILPGNREGCPVHNFCYRCRRPAAFCRCP
jgi:hypothetical protein